ncbi:STAS domain-containing protein [Candidatus Symbiobacter mobilis]|uniref:Sulfate transporter-like protein n=1 Tax=Candidatus Symbiobacter mobilis CR TaxID=946483 RepID=U5N4C8_9BURK|nr:STAS domain-containing protein [Candidatus Symbiobacter mobilis]AGX86182.1 sulfate transporter-like protein [Candidatus Symbiobacter mobilis CR]
MVALPPELTQHTAAQCLPGCLAALRAEAAGAGTARDAVSTVEVDAAEVQRFDSVALAVLLALRREALLLGKGYAVRNLPVGLQRLATLYGIDTLLLA